MEEYYGILRKSDIFQLADDNTIKHVLYCLEGHVRVYGKGEIIYQYVAVRNKRYSCIFLDSFP
nr:hypothetical protein [uncultured Clostridium sp.]